MLNGTNVSNSSKLYLFGSNGIFSNYFDNYKTFYCFSEYGFIGSGDLVLQKIKRDLAALIITIGLGIMYIYYKIKHSFFVEEKE